MTPSDTSATTRPKRLLVARARIGPFRFFVLGLGLGAYVMHDHYRRVRPGFVAMFDQHMVGQYAQLQYQNAATRRHAQLFERYLGLLLDPSPFIESAV